MRNEFFRPFKAFPKGRDQEEEGKQVPHEFEERDIKRPKATCEILLSKEKWKGFGIELTGDEKWFFYDHPKLMGGSRSASNVITSTRYTWKEGFAVYLMG